MSTLINQEDRIEEKILQMDTGNKYFTGEDYNVGAVLGIITENMELKANVGLFR